MVGARPQEQSGPRLPDFDSSFPILCGLGARGVGVPSPATSRRRKEFGDESFVQPEIEHSSDGGFLPEPVGASHANQPGRKFSMESRMSRCFASFWNALAFAELRLVAFRRHRQKHAFSNAAGAPSYHTRAQSRRLCGPSAIFRTEIMRACSFDPIRILLLTCGSPPTVNNTDNSN